MKSLVLAEKPSVGRDLAKVLGCSKGSKAYLEGKDYIVTWAMGHLVELADPEAYDAKFKTWELKTLPMLPERMRHKVIGKTSRQFREIKGLMHRKDVENLIIATDAGREGELVARWIMRLAGWKGRVQRLWISSQTDKAIKDGFQNLKPGRDFENLFRAAECRAEADWLVGLNVTRAMSCRYDARLSAGRVQTPTLALLVKREEEIESFEPKPYWTLSADFGKYSGLWQGKGGVTRFRDEERVTALAEKINNAEGRVIEVKRRKKSSPSPWPMI